MPDPVLNIENFRKLRERIAAEPDSAFYMPAFITSREGCGTAACMAGFCGMMVFDQKFSDPYPVVADLISERTGHPEGVHRLPDIARDFLGLTRRQADELFYYQSWENAADQGASLYPEKSDALRLLSKIIATGQFHDWYSCWDGRR